MASHSSVLAWRIAGTGSLVGCRLRGHTELDMTEATQQQQHAELRFHICHLSAVFSVGSLNFSLFVSKMGTIINPNLKSL